MSPEGQAALERTAVMLQVAVALPSALPADAGFKDGARGVQTSRTIMLAELTALLAAVPAFGSRRDYRAAIVLENVLGKRSVANRRSTAQRLGELYALEPGVTLFRVLRRLWDADESGRPLLACLCAHARDPLLRATAPAVLPVPRGSVVTKVQLADAVAQREPHRFNAGVLDTVVRNAASSWTQSGHLHGRTTKVRVPARATPASAAYALFLGHLAGSRGALLFATYWAALLDAPDEALDTLAFEAGRRGWLDYRRIGGVVEIGFAPLLREA